MRELLVGICYLDNSTGIQGNNLLKLAHMSAAIAAHGGPWIFLGDFNLSPAELRVSGWLQEMKATVILPEGVVGTK